MRTLRVFFLCLCLFWCEDRTAAQTAAFFVIVNKSNPVDELGKKQLEDIFLKKVKFWVHGGLILPVDLSATSPVRAEFSREILQRPVGAVRNYWQYMIFSGREVQPPEFESGRDVVDYVVGNPNAIGYISRSTDVSRVKVVSIGQ